MQMLNVGTGSENESTTLCHKNVHIFTWPGRDFLISHLVMFCANNRYIKIYNIMYCCTGSRGAKLK